MDEDYKICSVFLNISKAFDKIWHEGLVLEQNGNRIKAEWDNW